MFSTSAIVINLPRGIKKKVQSQPSRTQAYYQAVRTLRASNQPTENDSVIKQFAVIK